MTPSERERRIEAGRRAINEIEAWVLQHASEGKPPAEEQIAAAALDAADEAVPVVPATWDGLLEHLDAMYPADVFTGESGDAGARLVALARKLAEAEAAARDFAVVVHRYLSLPYERLRRDEDEFARRALDRHPSFSGEEGTDG